MRISQIKQRLSLEDALSYFGHEPDTHMQAHDKWFKSPFRPEETKASFHINTGKDIWFDHGEGEGGDLIDFAKAYNSKILGKGDSIKEALALLREIIGTNSKFNHQARKPSPVLKADTSTSDFDIIENVPLRIGSLLENLDRRKISRKVASQYLRQIKFIRPDSPREYYGYGFRNNSGGFEFSNPIGFKTALGNKDMTYIKGHDPSSVEVFEGAPDFLTRLTIQETMLPYDTLVLNSTSTYDRAALFIISKAYMNVVLWLDNDHAGEKAAIKITERLQTASTTFNIIEMNQLYEGFNDLNQWHTETSLSLAQKRSLIHQKLLFKSSPILTPIHSHFSK